MGTRISGLAYTLPHATLDNTALERETERWSAQDILAKTGVELRHVAGEGECASDLAVSATGKLFRAGLLKPSDVDFLFLVTQTPDYLLPPTACVIQSRLGLPTSCAALDINLGCSGFIYALGMARAWIASGMGQRGLVVTADTYTRLTRPGDISTRAVFGDGAAATLVEACAGGEGLGSFVFGTDGSGAERLMVRTGGMRHPLGTDPEDPLPRLRMDGPSVFTFTLNRVPHLVDECSQSAGCDIEAVDLFVFHQANAFMLEHLRTKIGIPQGKLPVRMQTRGNTVSSSIPILLNDLVTEDAIRPQMRLMLVGFGVGYSWAACILDIAEAVPQAVAGADA